jgi:metal-responsive CopG/Arc/MetJ family transcriptional regulator
MAKGHQQVMVRMPADLHEEIKRRAEAKDLTMAQAIRAAVRNYLQEEQVA